MICRIRCEAHWQDLQDEKMIAVTFLGWLIFRTVLPIFFLSCKSCYLLSLVETAARGLVAADRKIR